MERERFLLPELNVVGEAIEADQQEKATYRRVNLFCC